MTLGARPKQRRRRDDGVPLETWKAPHGDEVVDAEDRLDPSCREHDLGERHANRGVRARDVERLRERGVSVNLIASGFGVGDGEALATCRAKGQGRRPMSWALAPLWSSAVAASPQTTAPLEHPQQRLVAHTEPKLLAGSRTVTCAAGRRGRPHEGRPARAVRPESMERLRTLLGAAQTSSRTTGSRTERRPSSDSRTVGRATEASLGREAGANAGTAEARTE